MTKIFDTWHPEIVAGDIAPGAIGTEELEDLGVEPEDVASEILKARMLESLIYRRQIFYEDFLGSALDLYRWTVSGDAGLVYGVQESIIHLQPKAVSNSIARINWGGNGGVSIIQQKPITLIARIASNSANSQRWRIGLYKDANKYVAFELDTDVSNNWKAVCKNTTTTSEDTGITAASHTPYWLEIEIVSNTEVKFSIDNNLVKTVTTDIPAVGGTIMEPLVENETLIASALGIYVDKIFLIANPYSIAPP